MIRDIRADVGQRYELSYLPHVEGLVVSVDAEIQGDTRWLGNLVNFRLEPPSVVVFDFEEASEFGVLFAQDFRNGRVRFGAQFKPDDLGPKPDGSVMGDIVLEIEGTLTTVELPTTACAECPKLFPVCDAYRSVRNPDRLICPECFNKGQAAGKMKEAASGAQNQGATPGRIPRY